jgi:hypothetical protein
MKSPVIMFIMIPGSILWEIIYFAATGEIQNAFAIMVTGYLSGMVGWQAAILVSSDSD